MAGLKLEPKPKKQSDAGSADLAAATTTRDAEAAGARAGLPLFLQTQFGRIQNWSAGSSDPEEREAEGVAQFVSGGRYPAAPPLSATPRAPLSLAVRRAIEPVLGADLSGVNVHSGLEAHAAASRLNARAFTTGRDIVLGEGESSGDVRLMAHESTHVVQQSRSGPAVQCQPKSPPMSPPGTGKYTFIPPQPAPSAPGKVPTEVQVAATDPRTGKAATQTVVLEEPVNAATPITFYAIPIELTSLAPDKNQGLPPLAVPGQAIPDKDKIQPLITLPPGIVFPPLKLAVDAGGEAVIVEKVTSAYLISSQYHHLAVGAGATTVLETKQGFRLIDAGVGSDGRSDLSDAIMERLAGIIGDKPIVEVMITHLHADHTNLLPRIAEKFPIGKLRTSAAQFADPRFQQLLKDIAEAQVQGVAERAKVEFDAKRSDWEAREGSKIGDVSKRNQAFENAKELYARDAVANARATPTTVELFVPEGGRLRVASALLGTLPDLTGATTDPVTEGLRREGAPGDISDTAFVDPKTGQILKEQQERLKTDPKERIPNLDVDTASASFIVDLPHGNRLIVVPDVRTADLTRGHDPAKGESANLVRELTAAGYKGAKFTAWNMTHHMQSGWVSGQAPHIAGASQIEGFIALIHDVRTAQGGNQPGKAGPADLISVSAQHNIATRTMVNPAMAWFLESLGFKVLLAAGGRDVRLIEAVTASGQRIAGVSGVAYAGLRPTDPLLMESEAALRYLENKIADAKAEPVPPRKGTKAAEYSAASEAKKNKIAQLEKAKNAIKGARAELIKVASEAFWVGAHEDKPAKPERAAEVPKFEQALRDAMKAPELSSFMPPKPGDLPVVSDTALVLMRIQGDQPVDTRAQQILESNQRADALRAKIQAGQEVAESKAKLTAELENLRKLINEQLPHSPEASQPVLKEELGHINNELDSLVHSPEGQILFSREPGTGRIVENRIVRAPVSKAAQRIQGGLEKVNRALGALMVYQSIKGQEQLDEQELQGRINKAQKAFGTAKNLEGVSIGLRMMAGVHVSPYEFVIMSAFDIAQTLLGDYDTPEQKAVAISQSVIRAGITLGLMAISGIMMESGHPVLMLVGFAINFLVEPIMEFLDWLGLFDWIERKSAFLPSEVTGASQHLRKLIKDYRTIIGDIHLTQRSDEQLAKMGAEDTGKVRDAAQHDMAKYREKAVEKEKDLLSAFEDAYKRVRDDYAGLYELDTLRSQFLSMREEARRGDQAHDDETRQQALDTFAAIDKSLNLDELTPRQVAEMPQWSKLRDGIDDFEALLGKSSIDWEDVRKKETEVEQMLRNARYRIEPGKLGLRTDPLLSPGTEARKEYETRLAEHETRMKDLVASMSSLATIGMAPIVTFPGQGTAETLLFQYNLLLDRVFLDQPVQVPDARDVYRGSIPYEKYVKDNDTYQAFLDRLRSMEIAMQAAAAREPEPIGPPAPGQLPVGARIESAISRRRDQLGYLYVDEYHQMYGDIQKSQAQELAGMLGEPKDMKPLSDEEKEALDRGQLEDYQKQITTLANQLEDAHGLHIPDKPDEVVGGINRVVGTVGDIDLIILSIPGDRIGASDNVLVAVLDEGHEVVTGRGHDVSHEVVAVNQPAVAKLGKRPTNLNSNLLQPVYLRELLPKKEGAAAK
jgi:hypothetical protein